MDCSQRLLPPSVLAGATPKGNAHEEIFVFGAVALVASTGTTRS
jgi:hypothetical protein